MTVANSTDPAVTRQRFRTAMRRLPTSVVVAAGTTPEGHPIGMVVGTFSTVSMDPLLVGFFGDHRSSTLGPLTALPRWTFSLLDQDHSTVVDSFRKPRSERFDEINWTTSRFGTPVVDDAVLVVHASRYSVQPAGDHQLVLGEVLDVELNSHRSRPLVYFERRLTRLDPGHTAPADSWQLGWND